MAVIESYSSVEISDSLDVGSLSSYLSSSQPTTVVYDPNTDVYTPNWASASLVITPTITYNGTPLSLTANELSITYQRKDGSSSATSLTTGESLNNGVLTVSRNKLSESTSGIITYICTVTYTDPYSSVPITVKNSITYSLLTNASQIKHAYITGETTFLYDSLRNVIGTGTLTIHADVQNVSVSKWEYLNSSGNYVTYPNSGTETDLVVRADEGDIWNNGRTATIKLVTSDPDTYDIVQIQKIYDGANGTETVSVILTNTSHYVPCDDEGNVLSWNGASTEIHIYEGGQDVTAVPCTLLDEDDAVLVDENGTALSDSNWTVTISPGPGISGTFENFIFTPTNLTLETSYVDFICSKEGYSNLRTRYSITKSRSGADGESPIIYEVGADTYVLNLSESGAFSPASVKFSAHTISGESITRIDYPARFIIYESTDGINFTEKYRSAGDEYVKTYTPSSVNVVAIRCVMYASGSTTTILDEQMVVITKDGIDGAPGMSGMSIGLSNSQDIISCNENGYAAEAKTITIPFYAYLGIERVPVTASIIGSLPSGVSLSSNTSGTTSADGQIVLQVAKNATFGNASTLTGAIIIRLVFSGGSVDRNYIWTKNLKGVDGTSTSILQIYSDDGNIIRNSVGTVTLKARYINGGTVVTPTSLQWYKFQTGSYKAISGATAATLTVTAAMVDDMAFFKCIGTYGGVSCEDYYTVDDIQDLINAEVFSTVAEFKNGEGYGAVYTRLYRPDGEIDPLLSTVFSAVPPTNPSNNDYYYHLDRDSKTVTLKKYNGSSWVSVTENYKYTYKYYRINKDGQALDKAQPYKTSRCVYVDPTVVGEVMQFICEVDA